MQLFPGNYRWFIVFLLFIATTINYVDRQLLGLLKPMLEKEFIWSESDFAYIVMAFSGAYAVGLALAGRFIDRVGTKAGISISVVFWSLAGMAHALAKSVTGFILARLSLGLGESGNFPGAAKAVAEWFPKKERGIATGIFNAGPSVGVIVSLLLVPLILRKYGWQEVFWITGALGFIWLIFWIRFFEIPHKQHRLSARELSLISEDEIFYPTEKQKITWGKLFLFPQTWAMVAGKFFIDPIFWFFLFWLPSYFSEAFSLDLKKPSLPLMTIYLAATLGSLGGGVLSSWLIRKGWTALNARKFSLFIVAVAEVSVLFTQFASGPWMAVILISISIAFHQAWSTNIFTMASDLFPVEAVGSVAGIAGMAGSLGGFLFPLLIGFILDFYKTTGNITTGYHLIFTMCGLTYIFVALLIHILTRKAAQVPLSMIQHN
jgi:ACS family hexuronate transporter-like MFS transporter